MRTDIDIARAYAMAPIADVAAKVGLLAEELEPYGRYKAKVGEAAFTRLKDKPDGKLILVSAINPTPAGEGKTTTTVGLAMALNQLGKTAVVAMREPSLGPVFGLKGGAAGGGHSQVVPMEEINLHFTGDMHAVTSANNLLCALMDNHIHQGNALGIDPRRVLFKRCLDMNDRALRSCVVGLGGRLDGIPREDGFQITVASEIMAVLCLAEGLRDLKRRLGDILVALTYGGQPVRARDLGAEGAMAALLRDAVQPNLVQTLEGTPALVHGGPFANIAHGCNSVRATKLALKLGDYAVTEGGFGSDLGAEKFMNIKCRSAGLSPDAAVLVATVRALKYNGGVEKSALSQPDVAALKRGLANLGTHIENMRKFGVPVVVAVNRFAADSREELAAVSDYCGERGAAFALSDVFAKGGAGGEELARQVVRACESGGNFRFLYELELSLEEKVERIAREIYGADGVDYDRSARRALMEIAAMGGAGLPVCMAKTQYSLSDDPKLLGRPTGFRIQVKDAKLCAGAGFVVVYTGDVMTMPGLPKNPAATGIDVNAQGEITGLF